jgi:hypothetical protein
LRFSNFLHLFLSLRRCTARSREVNAIHFRGNTMQQSKWNGRRSEQWRSRDWEIAWIAVLYSSSRFVLTCLV